MFSIAVTWPALSPSVLPAPTAAWRPALAWPRPGAFLHLHEEGVGLGLGDQADDGANLRPSVMPNLDLYRRHVLTALQYADVIKASDEDLACLNLPGADALAQARHLLQGSRASVLALTMGSAGAALLTRSGQVFQAREQAPVDVMDTVGAGDCFLAGLVAAMLRCSLPSDWGTRPVDGAVARVLLSNAIASASLCVMRRGCVPPSHNEVQARLAQATIVFSA
jgi:fructokinase